jgi:hypothetical protein
MSELKSEPTLEHALLLEVMALAWKSERALEHALLQVAMVSEQMSEPNSELDRRTYFV